MPFKPGQSGNPAGRPKRDSIDRAAMTSLRAALEKVCRDNPTLLADAIKRLLQGSRSSLGMLELAAKLNRELQDEQQANKIAIVFTGNLDRDALRRADAKVIECPQDSKEPEQISDLSSTTTPALSASNSLKIEPSVADSTDLLVQVNRQLA